MKKIRKRVVPAHIVRVPVPGPSKFHSKRGYDRNAAKQAARKETR